MPAWVFERENRELRFIVRFFQESGVAALHIEPRPGVSEGASVR